LIQQSLVSDDIPFSTSAMTEEMLEAVNLLARERLFSFKFSGGLYLPVLGAYLTIIFIFPLVALF